MPPQLFFSGWESLLRTLVVGALTYVVLVAFLRVSGKRTLAKMNAFDLVVTVALGSTLATVLLSKDVALADGHATVRHRGFLPVPLISRSGRARLAGC